VSNFKPVSLIYPIVFFGGVMLLCAWTLHGNRVFAPFARAEHAIADDMGGL
jgi:hypothetical protein